MKSTTSSISTTIFGKARYIHQLFAEHKVRRTDGYRIRMLGQTIAEYERFCGAHLGGGLNGLRALEIGYGPRPFLACAMHARGAQVIGIDLEQPLLSVTGRTFLDITRKNGLERAIKSVGRLLFFDPGEKAMFEQAFDCAFDEAISHLTLLVGDASEPEVWRSVPQGLDLVYSEDVFEHIEQAKLDSVLTHLCGRLRPGGLALIRPHIWTGITGGHFVEWYHDNVDKPGDKARPPWLHVLTGEGEPSVYLNRLRLEDYEGLLSRHFDILEVVNGDYGLGSNYLSESLMKQMPAGITRDDLLTNRVLFVMRPR